MRIEYDLTFLRVVSAEGVRGYRECYLPYYSPSYSSKIVDEGVSKELLKHIKRKNN